MIADIESLAYYGGIHAIEYSLYRSLTKRFPECMCRWLSQAKQQELHEIKIFFTSYRCYVALFEAKNSSISIIAMTRAKRHTYGDYFGAENIKIGPANAIVWN